MYIDLQISSHILKAFLWTPMTNVLETGSRLSFIVILFGRGGDSRHIKCAEAVNYVALKSQDLSESVYKQL